MKNNLVGMIFSKDRAMQLDATLRSFYLNCRDSNGISLMVIYATSSIRHEAQYNLLKSEYSSVRFIRETRFKDDVLNHIFPFEYVLFLVDDSIFVRGFSLKDVLKSLEEHPDAIGFSLRLGRNTTYCYPYNRVQNLPRFNNFGHHMLKFDWTRAELDFGYPLEVSSSVYRVFDLHPELKKLSFTNPNTFEAQFVGIKYLFAGTKPALLCYEQSVAFSAPLNLIQSVCPNRVGQNKSYTISSLEKMFRNGQRVDVKSIAGFIPNACHQEVELTFIPVPVHSVIKELYSTYLYNKSLIIAGIKKSPKKTKIMLHHILRSPYSWLRNPYKHTR
jgi:hypothetical protein